jgi:hypothetical protein
VFVAVLVSSSLPFWLLLGSVQLDGFGLLLPASALMVVCPMIAATVLTAVEGGRAQVATLWRRSVDVTTARYAGLPRPGPSRVRAGLLRSATRSSDVSTL